AQLSDQNLRDRIVATAAADHVNALIRRGLLGPADLPGVLRHHEATPDLIVSLARRDLRAAALEVIETLELSALVAVEMSAGLPQPEEPVLPTPKAPDWLLDALVRRSLTIVTAGLEAFATANSQPRNTPYWQPEGWPAYSVCGLLLKRCPERWPELVEDPVHGQAVRHALLDSVDTAQISDEVLAACVPALCLPEWADLPLPERTQRRRLRTIAQRVASHPRLKELAAAQLHDAAAACLARSNLVQAVTDPQVRHYAIELTGLAEDLAVTSNDADVLGTMCTLVARLPEPTAIERRYAFDDGEPPSPKLLLSSDQRIGTLAALAGNPHLDRSLITNLLEGLHPVEVQWLLAYEQQVPAWLRQAAADHAAAHPYAGPPRVLTDEELDDVDDPLAVMQGWLEAIKGHRGAFMYQVEYTILESRHCTDALLRQLPAHVVLGSKDQSAAADALLQLCGNDPARWQAIAETLSSPPDFEETLGQFLDRHSMKAGRVRTPTRHEPVMKLIRASMNPASRTARRPVDSPAGRVVSAAARADADENGTDRIFLLAAGASVAATGIALVLTDETEQTVDELLSAIEEAAERGAAGQAKLNTLPVIRGLLTDQESAAEVLGATFARDQGEFFDLILELADFTATCITIREARSGTPVADTLADLEEMLKEFVDT
ncbi:hypothetical protein, partial [Streptomyces sp. KR55]|uniref:hypothetical protein n=1 Tax=Streptomyces sp. KR55 TaxID=3457425 RepID=UPI003FCEE7DC